MSENKQPAKTDDVCPSGLQIRKKCDCGKHRNYPLTPPCTNERTPFESLSHYTINYKAIRDQRPRSSKRPQPDFHLKSNFPMYFDTNHKNDYKNLGSHPRVKPVKHTDSYQPSNEPLQSATNYTLEYTPKKIESGHAVRCSNRDKIPFPQNTVSGNETTNKEHYKKWDVKPPLTYGDIPSFTGSVLRPGKELDTTTTFQSSFRGQYQAPAEISKSGQTVNLKNEGEMFMTTTSSLAYVPHIGDYRSKRVVPSNSLQPAARSKFSGDTQNKSDFRRFSPIPQKPCEPPLSTMELKFDNSKNFTTEHKDIFQGHDVSKLTMTKSCKEVPKEYHRPAEKFESLTSQKSDYKVINLGDAPRRELVRKNRLSANRNPPPFATSTTNKSFFKDWGVTERVRHGDTYEKPTSIVPNQELFMETVSTTKDAFSEKRIERTEQIKPTENMWKSEGSMNDINTEYTKSYKHLARSVCPSEELIMRKTMCKNQVVSNLPGTSTILAS